MALIVFVFVLLGIAFLVGFDVGCRTASKVMRDVYQEAGPDVTRSMRLALDRVRARRRR